MKKDERWYVMVMEGGFPVFVTSTQYKVRATFEAGKSPKDFGSREWAEEVVERLAGHNILAYVVYSEYPVCLPIRPASYEHFDWSID